jgi:predicted ArsR family transcriptional regulator
MANSLTIDMLSFATGMDCIALRQHLDFLMMNGLIEERTSRKKKMCSLTAKGIAVLNTLSSKEYFSKTQDLLTDVDETVQLSRVSKEKHES